MKNLIIISMTLVLTTGCSLLDEMAAVAKHVPYLQQNAGLIDSGVNIIQEVDKQYQKEENKSQSKEPNLPEEPTK